MNNQYRKIKINKSDTLDTLSEKLGLEKQEMIGFHNVHAKQKELIIHDLPVGLEELYVYPFIYQKIKDSSLKVKLESDYKLVNKPTKQTLHYGVLYYITSGEEENTIKFEISVKYLKQDYQGLYYEVNKTSPTFINDSETDIIADVLAEKVAAVFYPLTVIVNEQGKWIGIANYEAVKSRWQTVKKTIYKDYEGQWIADYVQECENNLATESRFVQTMAGNWFLNAYFSGIYNRYGNAYHLVNSNFGFENKTTFPILTDIAGLQYATKYYLQELLDEDQIVKIDVTGILDDSRSKADIENRLNFSSIEDPSATKATGSYTAKYFLDTATQTIESMVLECSIELDIPQKVKIVIATLK
jgi:hypothetical protein